MKGLKKDTSATLLDVDESILTNSLRLHGGVDAPQELSQLLPDPRLANAITISPLPGMCVKTKLLRGDNKIFINVCTSGTIPPPEDLTDDELLEILNSDEPSDFRIPMSIGAPHEEVDKKGKSCTAYDVVVNPEFLDKARDNLLFNNFFVIATCEALEMKYDIELDKNGWTILKNKLYLGTLEKQSVRTAVPLVQELSGKRPAPKSDSTESKESLLTVRSSRSLTESKESLLTVRSSRSLTESKESLKLNSTDDLKNMDVEDVVSQSSNPISNKDKHARQLTPLETRKLQGDNETKKKLKPKCELKRLLSENKVGPKEMIGVAAYIELPGQMMLVRAPLLAT
ncbi:PIH1 domain-containing protein 1 [Hyalella azteca]|uniref:PIH1 domain-containing protein 1 n=1 Tax=Hyalella azteca TaxID=294128 RepID=A0A8B7N1E5_HYAAZ|nr:PIH1 domain-containing protein 1 [Hyalella azteca]